MGDIIDAYGTFEELELFTEAIGRFDICKIKITHNQWIDFIFEL